MTEANRIQDNMLFVVRRASLSRIHELFVRGTSLTCTAAVRMASVAYDGKVVPKDEVVRFIADCMCKAGTTPEDAHVVAHHLMTADYRGHFSHGMNRMQMYVNEIENRITDCAARPRVVTDFQV